MADPILEERALASNHPERDGRSCRPRERPRDHRRLQHPRSVDIPSAAASVAASVAPAPSAAASAGASTAVGSVSIGSYHTDPGEPEGQKAVDAAFTAATGIAVKENIVDHSTFQNQISNYLGGQPDSAYTWFSGFRMKFFAAQGLSMPIDDLWAKVKDNFSEGFQQSVVGNDGKVYGIPTDYYPWAVFYRKSVFAEKGYTIPATWDDLKTLCAKMKTDGLTPIAFADQEGWPRSAPSTSSTSASTATTSTSA